MEETGLDNHTGFLTGSIDDYLLGLADGIQKAQRQLSQMAITLQPGEAAVTYQIPRVEFELKMSLEVATPADDKGGGGAQLRFRPASPVARRRHVDIGRGKHNPRGICGGAGARRQAAARHPDHAAPARGPQV